MCPSEPALINQGSQVRSGSLKDVGTLQSGGLFCLLHSIRGRHCCRLTQAWLGKSPEAATRGPQAHDAASVNTQRSQAATFTAAGSTNHVLVEFPASREPSSQERWASHRERAANILGIRSIFRIPSESPGHHRKWLKWCLQRQSVPSFWDKQAYSATPFWIHSQPRHFNWLSIRTFQRLYLEPVELEGPECTQRAQTTATKRPRLLLETVVLLV